MCISVCVCTCIYVCKRESKRVCVCVCVSLSPPLFHAPFCVCPPAPGILPLTRFSPPRFLFPATHRAPWSAGVDGEVGLCVCVCLSVRLLPVTGPMCEGWGLGGVGVWRAEGCSVGTRGGGGDPEQRAGRGPSPPHHPGGGQGSCQEKEEEDGGGRRGAPSSRRAGCTGVCPARGGGGACREDLPPSSAQGYPGPCCTHRWVPGRCWSIHAAAWPGRLPFHAAPCTPDAEGCHALSHRAVAIGSPEPAGQGSGKRPRFGEVG